MRMGERLDCYKPAASARSHLLLAAMMWTVVGMMLLFFGVRWLLAGRIPHVSLLLLAAVAAGILKGRFVLKRAGERLIERIERRGDGRCIGGFLSLQSWAFVVVMVGAGRLMRGGVLPRPAVGFVYAAVGTALLMAVRTLWCAWYRHGADA